MGTFSFKNGIYEYVYKTLLSTPGFRTVGLLFIFRSFKVIFLVIVPYFCLDSMLFLLGICHML